MPTAQSKLRIPLLTVGLVMALAGCPTQLDPLPPVTKPQVAIHMPVVDVVGEDLSFTVNVSGCETLQTLEIYDGSRFIKSVPPSLPATEVTVRANELDYSRGFALSIAFRARAVCGDGRENLSRAQAATYMPVERVFTPPVGEYYVPDLFTVEGSGDDATFLGCTWNPVLNATSIVRVDLQGEVVAESSGMPFTCTHRTVFTEVDPLTGKRWVWDPEGGAVAVHMDDLVFSGQFLSAIHHLLVVPGSGDAVVFRPHAGLELRRIAHANRLTPPIWIRGIASAGLFGLPAITPEGIFVPVQDSELIPGNDDHLSVSRLDLATGEVAETTLILLKSADTVPYSEWPDFYPAMRFDGEQIYVPHLGVGETATIRACSTEFPDCSVWPGRVWESEVPHPEWPTLVYPYANGTRVIVVSNHYTTVLDAADGRRLGGQISPEGAQFFSAFAPGRQEAFYLLTSSNNAALGSLPSGIIAVDAPELGPVFRYNVRSGSLAISVDETGLPWLRMGARLVKPLPLSDYREALGNGPSPED